MRLVSRAFGVRMFSATCNPIIHEAVLVNCYGSSTSCLSFFLWFSISGNSLWQAEVVLHSSYTKFSSCWSHMTERYPRTPIATTSASGRRSTPQTDAGTTPSTDGVPTAPRTVLHGAQTAARPLTPTQENQLIDTVTKLGARAAPAALLSVISICRQYLAEPQQQTAVLQTLARTQKFSHARTIQHYLRGSTLAGALAAAKP